MSRLLLCIALFPVTPASAGQACLPLPLSQPVKSLAGAGTPCFTFTVAPGEPVSLVAEQPADLALRLAYSGGASVMDGFSFGPESATVVDPGEYRVEILPAPGERAASIRFTLSRRALHAGEAAARAAAERASTQAKTSGKSGDFERAFGLWMAVGDSSAAGRVQVDLGAASVPSGNLAAARDAFERALELCRGAGDTRCAAEAANNGGWAAQQLGDFDRAFERLTQAAADMRRLGDRKLEGQTLSNLGLLFRQTGDYHRAISYYDRAAALLASRDALANARVLNNLGVSYQFLAEYAEARGYFARALQAFAANSSPRDAVRALLNLGRTQVLEGHPALGRATLTKALADATALSDRAARADALSNLAQAGVAENAPAAARATLDDALTLHRALGDKRGEASDLHYLGLASSALRQLDAARDYLRQALSLRRSVGLRDAATDSLFALADLERAAGHADAARALAAEALDQAESVRRQVPGPRLRASFYARQRRLFDLMVDLEADSGDPRAAERAWLAAERGRARALLDLLAEPRLVSRAPAALLDRRDAVERRMDLLAARLISAKGDAAADLRRQVEQFTAEGQQIETQIRDALGVHAFGRAVDSAASFQARDLPAESALLEFHLGARQSYVWLIGRETVEMFRLPPRSELEAQSAPVLRLFPLITERQRSAAAQRRFDTALRRLSATLLGPLAGRNLPPRLIVAADGVLTGIPFAALEFGRAGRLGLVHDLVQTPSAAFLGAGRAPRSPAEFPKAFLALADPVYSTRDPRVEARPAASSLAGGGLARLPFDQELAAVKALLPPARREILTGFDAAVKRLARSRPGDYAVLHFSAHALIDGDIPELSRIALSSVDRAGRPVEGFLRPHQLSELSLNGSLVALSACDTALGKQVPGEGMAGFTTSLFAAGAGQLVLTVAPVDAEGSSEFFAQVYRRLFAPRPLPVERAAAEARRALARSSRWADPYYWASFVVYGRTMAGGRS